MIRRMLVQTLVALRSRDDGGRTDHRDHRRTRLSRERAADRQRHGAHSRRQDRPGRGERRDPSRRAAHRRDRQVGHARSHRRANATRPVRRRRSAPARPTSSAKGKGDAITPSFAAWEGVNPRSVYVAPARQGGVTNVITAPGEGGVVSGQAAVLDLVDGTVSDMLVKAPAAMFANFDFPPTDHIGARGELFARIRELLDDTKAFMQEPRGVRAQSDAPVSSSAAPISRR